ncbi:MAG: type II toxin-antitoxin system RelE/ParE family toxin [Bacteroidales bacterium]|nr:type II toxin-antitoxin system RelE/ParE family toxin [Bacteroidales bacterium]
MITEIRFSEEFQKSFKRLKKRYHSLPDDFKDLLLSLQADPYQGAELHDGMRKVRLSIASKGKGKSGGGRVIIRLTIEDTRLSFLYIYDKSDMSNVSEQFLDYLIKEVDSGME